MADLRYRWGDHAPQESPAPPRATTVALVLQRLGVTDGLSCPTQGNDRISDTRGVRHYGRAWEP